MNPARLTITGLNLPLPSQARQLDSERYAAAVPFYSQSLARPSSRRSRERAGDDVPLQCVPRPRIIIRSHPLESASLAVNRRELDLPRTGSRHQFLRSTLQPVLRNACHYWRQYFRNVFHEMPPFYVMKRSGKEAVNCALRSGNLTR